MSEQGPITIRYELPDWFGLVVRLVFSLIFLGSGMPLLFFGIQDPAKNQGVLIGGIAFEAIALLIIFYGLKKVVHAKTRFDPEDGAITRISAWARREKILGHFHDFDGILLDIQEERTQSYDTTTDLSGRAHGWRTYRWTHYNLWLTRGGQAAQFAGKAKSEEDANALMGDLRRLCGWPEIT